MRLLSGGVSHLACVIEDDLAGRDTGLHKPHINALADLASCVLACRNANTSEWIAIPPDIVESLIEMTLSHSSFHKEECKELRKLIIRKG